jgi:uncharacterized RDD family membrane protein YckC
VTMDQPGGGSTPPSGQQTPPPPPPQQGWQSTPTPPGAPPPMGGQPGGGMPSWTSNITARGTMGGPAGVALADVPDRIIALIIDAIILGVIGFIVNMITTTILGDRISFGGIFGVSDIRYPSLVSSLASVVIMLVVSGAYFIGMWTRMGGATVGMKVMKLSVRDAASGGPITQQQAINRWLLLGAPYAANFLYGWGIGIIVSILVLVYFIYLLVTTAQSPTRQGLHDQYAKTVVAKGA